MDAGKFAVSVMVAMTLGLGASAVSHAGSVLSWDLQDYNGDGLQSDLEFFVPPPGDGTYTFGATDETGCINTTNPDGTTCAPLTTDGNPVGADVFTAGFDLDSNGIFRPNVTFLGVVADVSNNVLTFSELRFGGVLNGQQYFLAPDDINTVTVEDLTRLQDDADGNQVYGVVVRYVSTVFEFGPYYLYPANWRLEGIMTVEPEPASPTCADVTPITTVATSGGGQSARVNNQVRAEFTGQITTMAGLASGGRNQVTICAGTTVDYSITSTDGSTVICNAGAMPALGTAAPGDKLVCTNKPEGDDTDRYTIKSVP